MENPTQVKCPKCGTLVNVESIIAHRIEENLKNEFNQKYLDLKTVMEGEVKQKEITLQKQQEELTKNTAAFETKVNEKVALEAAKQQKQLQEKIYGEFEIQLKSATAENADNKKRIDELSKAAIENESLKRKKMNSSKTLMTR
ncbi:MAG: hypothetical protein NTX03_02970 [Bacteroidetes bacterium]|nr:hypothetical protein [Bacteroidota bacterium]